MTDRKSDILFAAGVFVVCFFFSGMAAWGSYRWNERLFYDKMAAVAGSLSGAETEIMEALKNTENVDLTAGRELLRRYSYEGTLPARELCLLFALGSILFAGICATAFLFYLHCGRGRLRKRAENLTAYLRQVEEGDDSLSPEKKQDIFSNLEDEIYKTVLALRESRERLCREKEKLADNLADISHQLKTPLTSLCVLSELLLRHVSGTEDAGLVRRMEGQTDRLMELTAALLTLARADAGVLDFEMRMVPVEELIECSLESVLPLMEEKGQRVELLGEKEAPEELSLCCDLNWMREALGNLLKNASEHAPERTAITIRVWENPVFTGIAVEDRGPGFSEQDLRHLFDRFYKGENSRGNSHDDYLKDSTGIGLALAKSLIEGQSGEIRAENRKGGGARFLIKFYKNF